VAALDDGDYRGLGRRRWPGGGRGVVRQSFLVATALQARTSTTVRTRERATPRTEPHGHARRRRPADQPLTKKGRFRTNSTRETRVEHRERAEDAEAELQLDRRSHGRRDGQLVSLAENEEERGGQGLSAFWEF
jgi:hypothetical protein